MLLTRLGTLDILGAIGVSMPLGYEDLLAFTDPLTAGKTVEIRVLRLEKLIELKEELGGEKDVAAPPVYRRVLNEKRSRTE